MSTEQESFSETFPVVVISVIKKRKKTNMAYSTFVSFWAFVFSLNFGVSKCFYSIPLKIYPGKYNVSSDVNLTSLQRVALKADGNGLSLASDPTGTVNFLDMVNNLQGDSGRGYYIEMSIGTPGQKVLYQLLSLLTAKRMFHCFHRGLKVQLSLIC